MCHDLTSDMENGVYDAELKDFEQELLELVEKPCSSNE